MEKSEGRDGFVWAKEQQKSATDNKRNNFRSIFNQ
jgi:hypothetical protein